MASSTDPLDTTSHVAAGRGARSAESHVLFLAEHRAGRCRLWWPISVRGGSGSDVTPGCAAPSASLFFGTGEAGSKDVREGPSLLERGIIKERIQGKEKIFHLLLSLSDLLGIGYLHYHIT